MYKENYHTHMRLCHHAQGSIEDYVLQAIDLGFTHLGMSDHGPLDNAGFLRMSLDEFYNQYLPEYHYCKLKYINDIKLYLGLEIEYLEGNDLYYKKLLNDLDYLILGCHYYSSKIQNDLTSTYNVNNKERLEEYVSLIEMALKTGYFKILAHPDFFLMGYPKYDLDFENAVKRICELCIKYNVYLECNVAGYDKGKRDFSLDLDYGYPNRRFFEIVSIFKDIKVIVSSDAHKKEDLDKNLERGYSMLEDLGIKPVLHPLENI